MKNKLGHIPTIIEFYEYGEIEPLLLIDYAKSYDRFIRLVDKDYKISFDANESAILEFVSSLLINGKRPHELLMLKLLMGRQTVERLLLEQEFETIGEKLRDRDYFSALAVLKKNFINTQAEKKRYECIDFIDFSEVRKEQVYRTNIFYNKLQHLHFYKELNNLIEYGLRRYEDLYREHDEDNLVLYQKYSRKDVCRILNWEKDDSSTIYGYRIKYGTCPIFVTYEKKNDIASSTKYADQFVNDHIFSWMTRSKVSLNSPETQELINYKDTGLKIYLFVKKSDSEGSDFYYMGRVSPIEWCETTIENDKRKKLPIVNFQLELQHAVRSDIYDYFTK